jgi:hypothetical protein
MERSAIRDSRIPLRFMRATRCSGSSAPRRSFPSATELPPITGRILAWLMICDPPEQSADDIAHAISASRAWLTTNMRLLTATGLVHRLMRSIGRTAYYRIDDDAWEKVIRQPVESMMAFGKIVEEGGSKVPSAVAAGSLKRGQQK